MDPRDYSRGLKKDYYLNRPQNPTENFDFWLLL